MDQNTIQLLLIDDNANYVSVLDHHLKTFPGKKFNLTWVNDGDQALEVLQGPKLPDLIILDYFLPKSNGIEVARRILESGINLPMILLTSNKDLRLAIEALKYGIEDYLIKEDLSDTILPRTIINTIERFQLHQQAAEMEKEQLFSQRGAEAIQELVVTMCHEFNNPLAAIKISVDILSRQEVSEPQKALLQKLNVNISKLENQIVRLRDLNTDTA
ncbi:MAG TPA: response regulator [Bacteroidota bacterium]|nr:response regulator [Bacteroidota bacterium]